jgi:phosphoadenosine phosphosulfate reductase
MPLVVFPPTDRVLIGYSGGKDSIAVVDLAVKRGLHVEAFFMYFVPNMDYSAYWVEFAAKTWGIKVWQYLHWDTVTQLRAGTFRGTQLAIPPISVTDIERKARTDSGIEWIGYGMRSQDSLERRGMMASWPGGVCGDARGKIFCPLKDWSARDVKAYLSRANLPIPKVGYRDTVGSGIDFEPETMAWLREFWPADYARILKIFPFAAAQADRLPEVNRVRADRKSQLQMAAKERRLIKKLKVQAAGQTTQ